VVTRALGGQAVELGVGTAARLNPLDDGPRPSGLDDASWQAQVRARRLGLLAALAEATLGRVLRATERTALDTALDTARCENSTPALPMVVDAMLEPEWPFAGSTVEELRSDGREVAHALARLVRGDLAGLFDGPSTVSIRPGLPMLSLDLSAISGSDTLIGLVMTCASTWMEAASPTQPGDSASSFTTRRGASWRSRSCSHGCRPSGNCRAPGDWRTSWCFTGCRISMPWATSVRRPRSRPGAARDTATRILYNEPFEEAQAAGNVLGLTSVEVAQLPLLCRGEGLWRVNERAFVVRHICTPDELTLFDTDARMLAR